jgi:hypothetical protein
MTFEDLTPFPIPFEDSDTPFPMSDITAETVLPVNAREWLLLGNLALEAAERARANGNDSAAERYTTLARRCDAHLAAASVK